MSIPNILWMFTLLIRCISSTYVPDNNPDYYLPTPEEIQRGFVIPAPSYWGLQVRKENSLRWLALGGSNTARTGSFVDFFNEVKHKYFPSNISIHIINGGVNAHGPVRMKYAFESKAKEYWPNVVSLEFGVNIDAHGHLHELSTVTSLIKFLKAKWKKVGLPPPSFFFIEIIKLISITATADPLKQWLECDGYSENKYKDPEYINPNISLLSPSLPIFLQSDSDLLALARFYRYPFISLYESLWPSFVRYFSTHNVSCRYPFLRDYVHINDKGIRFLVYEHLIPFFQQQLLPKPTDNDPVATSMQYEFDHMVDFFPPEYYKHENIFYEENTWNIPPPDKSFSSRMHTNTSSSFKYYDVNNHTDGLHRCFGTMEKGAKFVFNLPDPTFVYFASGHQNASSIKHHSLAIEYIHSWNKSYVGDAVCTLYSQATINSPIRWQDGESVYIHGNSYMGEPIYDTVPRRVVISEGMENKRHVLECISLHEDRLACFTKVEVSAI
jgi:hypothetical protein